MARRIIGEPSVDRSASRFGQFSGVGAKSSGTTMRAAQSQPWLSAWPAGLAHWPSLRWNFRSREWSAQSWPPAVEAGFPPAHGTIDERTGVVGRAPEGGVVRAGEDVEVDAARAVRRR